MYARKHLKLLRISLAAASFVAAAIANAASAPEWMRSQINMPLPAHDEETNAVQLYSETNFIVAPNGKMKRVYRAAYKILRPDGAALGVVRYNYDTQSRITSMRAWSIPTTGKDYEVKEKEAVDSAVIGVSNSELISDTRTRIMRIPAATVGSIIGYEVEQDQHSYDKMDMWFAQEIYPVREAKYILQLPPGWSYKSAWLNLPNQEPVVLAEGKYLWTLSNLKEIRPEPAMPPWEGFAGGLAITLLPPDQRNAGLQSWSDIAQWYAGLAKDRLEANGEIKTKVAELTGALPDKLAKIRALTQFVQSDIRYVAIELGIGGHQPHRASETFANRFGDCKDKATLLSTMLREIGIESHYVMINTERGSVTPTTPPHLTFNHVILAIALPKDIDDSGLMTRVTHPTAGKIVYFDPTDHLTPFGRVNGSLQANYGLLVAGGGELVLLPQLPLESSSVDRTAQMTLDERGTLRGDIVEILNGDPAAAQRYAMGASENNSDVIRPVEAVAAESFTSFDILKASVGNQKIADRPFEWRYTIEAQRYAKVAGDLLLVRPRVIGSKVTPIFESKKPRVYPIEFERPQRDKDVFEIEIPKGYKVDELPAPIDIDEGFVAYKSKTEVVDGKLRFTRTYEVKKLSAPASSADKLKHFYRIIGDDERRVAVLKRAQ